MIPDLASTERLVKPSSGCELSGFPMGPSLYRRSLFVSFLLILVVWLTSGKMMASPSWSSVGWGVHTVDGHWVSKTLLWNEGHAAHITVLIVASKLCRQVRSVRAVCSGSTGDEDH